MKFFYWIYVIAVSLEALVMMAGWLVWVYFVDDLQVLIGSLELNQELVKYIMLLPIGLAVWIFNEARALLQEDKEAVKLLIAWPGYWKLKVHVWVSLVYAVIFSCMSLLPWLTKSGISTSGGMLLFIVSTLGQLLLVVNVYVARIRIKEVFACARQT